jgi:hypothetical protein
MLIISKIIIIIITNFYNVNILKHNQLSGVPSTGVGRISESEKVSLQMVMERIYAFDDLSSSESEFQRVGTATENTSPSMSFNPGKRQQVKTI